MLRAFIAAFFALFLPVCAFAQTAPVVVYDDGLQNGWQDWSWAKTHEMVTIEDIKPIKIEGDAYSALYFHHAGFDTTGYKTLTFYINGGAGGQNIAVRLIKDNKPLEKVYEFKPNANEWGVVVVPLTDLGGENTVIDGIWLQGQMSTPYKAFFVTLMSFE